VLYVGVWGAVVRAPLLLNNSAIRLSVVEHGRSPRSDEASRHGGPRSWWVRRMRSFFSTKLRHVMKRLSFNKYV